MVKFEVQRAKWEALQIESYAFSGLSYWSAFPTVPFKVIVSPGKAVELRWDKDRYSQLIEDAMLNGVDYLEEPFFPFIGKTIDELIRSIAQRAIDEMMDTGLIITICYNQDYYFPEFFQIRPSGKGAGGAIGLRITQFTPLDGK